MMLKYSDMYPILPTQELVWFKGLLMSFLWEVRCELLHVEI